MAPDGRHVLGASWRWAVGAVTVGALVALDAPGAAAAALSSPPASAPPAASYPRIELLPDTGTGEALGVADDGVVVGDVIHGPQPQAAVWAHGRLTLVPIGLVRSAATSVNDAGLVVGQGLDAAGHRHGWRWNGRGTAQLLPSPVADSPNVQVRHVDRSGDIVGTAQDSAGVQHAVVWTGPYAVPHVLSGIPGSVGSAGHGVNDRGVVTGWSVAADGSTVATVWTPDGRPHRLPGPGADDAAAVDDAGLVVGSGTLAPSSPSPRTLFLVWRGDVVENLRTLPGDDDAAPNAVNDRSLAVGFSASDLTPTDSGAVRPVYWPGAGPLRELPGLPGSTFGTAHDVNDGGLIVGLAADRAGDVHPVVWRPSDGRP